VAPLRWEFAGQQPGSVERFLPESLSGASVTQLLPLPQGEGISLGLLSSDGRFKRLPLEEFQELSSRASSVLKLKEGVNLRRVVICREGQDLVVASSSGRLLRLAVNEANLPLMGRTAQGPMLLRLLPDEEVVGAACGAADATVLLVSRAGRLKRLRFDGLRLCQRGDLGQIGLRLPDRSDRLVDLCSDGSALIGVRLAAGEGRSLRLTLADLPEQDAAGEGQDLPLAAGDAVRELVPLISG
jgi:DNA gyrase subunit A